MNLRKSILHAMANLDCNQTQFAEKAKITRPYLSAIMSGKTKPGTVTLERMAEAAGMTVSKFIALGEE